MCEEKSIQGGVRMSPQVCNGGCTEVDDGGIEQHGEAMRVKEYIKSWKTSNEVNVDVDAKEVKLLCEDINPFS